MNLERQASRLAHRSGFAVYLLGAAILLALLFSRRSSALLNPGVWCEDGTQIIPSLIIHGIAGFFYPVNGYLITSSKFISAVSLAGGLFAYPLASSLLALLFSLCCVLAVWLLPTHLHYRFFCAAACVLVPSDPEVFGTPLYSFWWAGLLLMLLVLWQSEHQRPILRMGLLALGGLSSPVIVALTPFFWGRVLLYRNNRTEWLLAVAATLFAGIQMFFIRSYQTDQGASIPLLDSLSLERLKLISTKFVGGFAALPLFSDASVQQGFQILCTVAVVMVFVLSWRQWSVWLMCLAALFLVCVALSVARIDPVMLHPIQAGPRYFFYPFILLYWILAFIAFETRGALRLASFAICAMAAANSAVSWSRDHEDLRWRDHLRSSRFFDAYQMPVIYDGKIHTHWHSGSFDGVPIPWAKWAVHDGSQPTFPFRVAGVFSLDSREVGSGDARFVSEDVLEESLSAPRLDGMQTRFSAATSAPECRAFEVEMERGAAILFKTGPFESSAFGSIAVVGQEGAFIKSLPEGCTNWTILEFSNSQLPERFRVRFTGNGTSENDWFAVAVPRGGVRE